MNAMQDFKQRYLKPYPTWREALMVLESLGYRKVMPPRPIEEILKKLEERIPPSEDDLED